MGIITRFFVYILHEQHAVIIKSSLKRTGELFVNCRRENTMKAELLSIIEFMEKDRGLDRGTVIEAVEQAIETASRKIDDIPPGVRVRISPETGEITAYSEVLVVEDDAEMPEQEGTEEVAARLTLTEALRYSPEAHVGATIRIDLDIENFGRVAAQTAKQVIVQKIREAEREKILTEYSRRIGDLVHGTISRVERGNLIVDIGRTEAYMPRKEQSAIEHYRQGDRIRALVSDVKDTEEGRVPRVILSRSAPALIRRLFELEVPEIYDGIVEIKAIAREAGFRTKIAVVSHDPKIDSVGACVGLRGSRVKGIVQELSGEKIDIVRWSDTVESLVTNALQPVEVVQMFTDKEAERILVVVPDDQLSLAIGKSGQNIRLTSKLAEWKVDVVRQTDADRVAKEHGVVVSTPKETTDGETTEEGTELKEQAVASSPMEKRVSSIFKSIEEIQTETDDDDDAGAEAPAVEAVLLVDMKSVSERQVKSLAELGVQTAEELLNADRAALLALPGFGEKTLDKLIEKVSLEMQ